MYVNIRDIPHRTTDEGTWLEAGRYKVVRILENGNYLIITKQFQKERQLTIIEPEEIIND